MLKVDINLVFQQPISELPYASLSKRGLMHNHSYENEFNLHVNEISFSYGDGHQDSL